VTPTSIHKSPSVPQSSATRSLDVSHPEVHTVETSDGVLLRLTRYRGGDRGPVVLVHGLGVSSKIFSLETIETNLLEYLHGHGFDTWLLDYRVSSELPSAAQQSSADDVATKDYPAALTHVRTVTGAAQVDVIGHCYGATTLIMAMLAGLKGVRSAVCSQTAAHVVTPFLTRLKTQLPVVSAIRALGLDNLSARVSEHARWGERLYDATLGLYPRAAAQRCDSPTCRRIDFMYGPLYRHEQLNQATHDALPELFGRANLTTFVHLIRMIRHGHVVTAEGRDTYLGASKRLAIPITFLHGAMNDCFLPESTARTLDFLQAANGRELYERHIVPNYSHIDCIFGRNAAADVYPLVLSHFERIGA
jgi:cholesterol oxidase